MTTPTNAHDVSVVQLQVLQTIIIKNSLSVNIYIYMNSYKVSGVMCVRGLSQTPGIGNFPDAHRENPGNFLGAFLGQHGKTPENSRFQGFVKGP